jgi:hypothetical protein
MQDGTGAPRFSVVWEADRVPEAVGSVDHAAHYAMALAHALASAGYPPNRLEIAVQEPSPVKLDLEVHGDVPGLDEASFSSLARIAVSGCRIWQGLPSNADVRLRATLTESSAFGRLPALRAPEPESAPRPKGGRATILLTLGLGALAALLYLALHLPFQRATPTPLAILTPAAAKGGLRTILDEHFATPVSGWLNDPGGTAWFGTGGYHLLTRQPGQFVAVGLPIGGQVQDVVVKASFAKTAGPTGGGYGLVVRDQATSPLDGRTQRGRFLLLEVDDRGEIGIWQRDGSRWVGVMPWTRSDAVRPGLAENDLQAIERAGQLSFIVNDRQVAEMAYTDLPTAGGLGLFLGGDLNNEVTVDRLTVQVP